MIADPEQIVWLAGVATAFGVGLTNTVAVIGAPKQPLASGVMVKVTVIGALVVLINVPIISPTPLAGIVPVTATVLSLVQLNTVPATLPVNTTGVIALPEQIVWLEGVATALGVGLTITVASTVAPVQVIPPLV